jgi:DNA-binding FadR family transcriptional regulator
MMAHTVCTSSGGTGAAKQNLKEVAIRRNKAMNESSKARKTKTLGKSKREGNPPLAPRPSDTASRSTMVRTQRIPEQVAIDVRRRILRGELAVGASLAAEGELMSQYGISRPTLREALRILEAEQLIRVRRGGIGGAVVQRPDLDVAARQFGFVLQDRGATMADVHRARSIIEPPALASLAVSVTSAQLAELNARLDATNDAIGDPLRYSEAVENVRERIVEMTGAITLALIMRLLREVVQKHTTAVGGVPPDRWAKMQMLSQRSHQKLIKLIGTGNREAAEDFWREHLAEVEHHLGRIASTRVIDLIE